MISLITVLENAMLRSIAGVTLIFGIAWVLSRLLHTRHAPLESSVLRAALLLSVALPLACAAAAIWGVQPWRVEVPKVFPAWPDNYTWTQSGLELLSIESNGRYMSKVKIPARKDTGAARFNPQLSHYSSDVAAILAFAPFFEPHALVLYAWMLGAGYLLMRLLMGHLALRRLRDHASPAPAQCRQDVQEIAFRLGIATPPDVRLSDSVSGPMLMGIRTPVILLPSDMKEVTQEVLLHEIGHIVRRDSWWLLIGKVAVAIYFFHPLAWYVQRRQEAVAEEICDDLVLNHHVNPCGYARQLAELAVRHQMTPALSQGGIPMAALSSALGRRVQRILNTNRLRHLRIHRATLAVIMFSATLLFGAIAIIRPVNAQQAPKIITTPAPAPTPAPPFTTPATVATPPPVAVTAQANAAAPPVTTPAPAEPPLITPAPGSNNANDSGSSSSSKIIRKIEVEYAGPKYSSSEQIISLLSYKVGDEFKPQLMKKDIKALYATNRITNARIMTEPLPDGGLKLVVIVQGRPLIKNIVFQGFPKGSEKELPAKISSVVAGNSDFSSTHKDTEYYNPYQAWKDARALEEWLKSQGQDLKSTRVSYEENTQQESALCVVTFTLHKENK